MILSVDIGIKNLAFSIMNATDRKDISTYTIELWNVYDTLDTEEHLCVSIQKNSKICNKKCLYKWKSGNLVTHCCKSHFPKDLLPISKENHFKKKMVNDYLLQDIAKKVLTTVQNVYNEHKELFDKLTQIVMELQLKISPKMKFISHILYGKFTELFMDKNTTIRFVRASQKLKAYTGPFIECKLKTPYAKRKWLSIQYTKYFLENKFSQEQKEKWLPIFLEHKNKKDDLAEVILYCINGLYGLPKKQTKDKKGNCLK